MFGKVPTIRQLLTWSLLAIYGSVGVLGYGLHELLHVHHHHAHGSHAYSSSTGGCSSCSCYHQCCSRPVSQPSRAETEGLDVLARIELVQLQRQQLQHQQHVHVESVRLHISAVDEPCPICAVLAQAQSAEIAVSEGTLVSEVPTAPPADETLFPLYLPDEHFARGPPAC